MFKGSKTIMNIKLGICDGSTHATLPLYGPLLASAKDFMPHHTVLLISFPSCRSGRRIGLRARSQIDVDPDIAEAVSLRKLVLLKHSPVNEPFPADLFNLEAI